MKIYTVHVPVLRDGQVSSDPDRARFVRDGFYFWAFLFGPLWMIWNRLWLVLILYLVAIAALFAGLTALNVSSSAQFVVGFLIAVLIGCEAGSLRRWSLRRRRRQVAVVAARDLEEAERRFFESLADRVPSAPVAPTWPPSAPVAPASPDVLGLFPLPQPEPHR
jgi:hypothetical protein